jgi:hypothetical protein
MVSNHLHSLSTSKELICNLDIVLSDNESAKSGGSSKSSQPFYGGGGRGGFFMPGNQRFYHLTSSSQTDLQEAIGGVNNIINAQ